MLDPTVDPQNIVAAWGLKCSGPGWSNSPVVFLVNEHGKIREHWIQPEDQTNDMRVLHQASIAVTEGMVRAVKALYYKHQEALDAAKGTTDVE